VQGTGYDLQKGAVMPRMYTITQIAVEYGVARDSVVYAIKSRGIEPDARVGLYRLYTQSTRDRIVKELDEIAAKKGGVVA